MTVFNPKDDHPLNDDELNELQAFLISDIAPENALSLEGLDGFFCGLAVSPELVMPSEWLPLVWGNEEGPAFESEEQAERILSLIMRHWNSVNRAVRVRPDQGALFYVPLMFEPEGNPPDSVMDTGFGEGWASAFLMGAHIHLDSWDEALQNQAISDCFGPIILLEQGKNPDNPKVVVDYAERQSIAALLPAIAHELWLHWQSGEHTRHIGVPYRAGPQVGRNDPCPCGSGKKYKKCCLQ